MKSSGRGRPPRRIDISDEERRDLQDALRPGFRADQVRGRTRPTSRKTQPQETLAQQRIRTILLAANGMGLFEIAEKLGVDPSTVSRRLNRFREHRLDAISPSTRPRRRREETRKLVDRVLASASSNKQIAADLGLSVSTVRRIRVDAKRGGSDVRTVT